MKTIVHLLALALLTLSLNADTPWKAAASRVDITPDYPIRLYGYAVRKTESEGIEQRIHAKALAFHDGQSPALLMTVDSIGIPGHVTEEVARRLNEKHNLARERFAVCSSHSHCTPGIEGSIPNMFGAPLPPEQLATIARYTKGLVDRMETAASQALTGLAPARLSWSQGTAAFAANRRPQKGPVDHAMPLLRVTNPDGTLTAILVNYACHCTTLGGNFNKIGGDWAGYAQEQIEKDKPGAIALVAIGCGADANPMPRGELVHAQQYGAAIAAESRRLHSGPFKSLDGPLTTRFKPIDLSFDKQKLPTREQFEELAKRTDAVAGNARLQLAHLERTGSIQSTLPYSIQTFAFSDDLLMVFLPGEVVVDYSVRLKKELDAPRLWINAYSNDVPCYIPSVRILNEGGYEAESAMTYYGLPGRLSRETEELIISTVHELAPRNYKSN